MSATINIPTHLAPPRCQCGNPALGVYEWETKSFSNIAKHKAVLCATCGLELADKVRCYESNEGELIFYKPNSNVTILARFNYMLGVTGAMVAEKVSTPIRLPPPHTLVQTLNGKLEHRHRQPRVYCKKCDCAVNATIVVTIRTHRNGKQSRTISSTCSVCGSPTHNPSKD